MPGKRAIAKFAVSIIGVGSTAFALACALCERNLRIVTNNIAVAHELMSDSVFTV